MQELTCFKAYDVRGEVPLTLNEDIARNIGRAFAQVLGAKNVAVGYDIRLTSPGLAKAVMEGLCEGGADVHDIGMCGTEEIYFATFHYKLDGGIMVTASHNPMQYNGMKFVSEGSRPVSGDSGLFEIRDCAAAGVFKEVSRKGTIKPLDHRAEYIKHLLSYVDAKKLKPLKIAMDAGNGGAGLVIEALQKFLPFEIIAVHFEPDGNFPHGIPNPLLPEQRGAIIDAVRQYKADMGIAWDGDFDRCFMVDGNGEFIEGYYIVGLLAEAFLRKNPGAKIVHDPRLTWNTQDVVHRAGGVPVMSKTGHAFIKERMRLEDAVYGGEMSAHHYFRDFAYCDSGMIPWLLVAELVSASGKTLTELVEERVQAYPCSGEINFKVDDPQAKIAQITEFFSKDAQGIDYTDGLSMDFGSWRFNLRTSNTEPVIRLNVESRNDVTLMKEKTDFLSKMIAR